MALARGVMPLVDAIRFVGLLAEGAGLRSWHDMLATAAGLAGRRRVGAIASGDAAPISNKHTRSNPYRLVSD